MSLHIHNHSLIDGKLEQIFYSGSGGGKGGSPDLADVSGTSTDYANVLMAIGEGQMEGVLGGGKGFYLDDTPLLNEDGTENFEGMSYYFTPGTLDQPGLPSEANEVTSETQVGVEVKKSIPVTRTFVNNEVSAVRVRIGIRLQEQTEDGDVEEQDVRVRISIKEGVNGAFVERLNTNIEGRYPEVTAFQYLFYLNTAGGTIDQFSIRVEKPNDDDSTDTKVQDVQFLSFQEVIFTQLQYPNTAIAWVQFPAKLFKSVPKISIDVGGILFPIPSNATVDPVDGGLIYSGGWTGSFYTPAIAPADPAWILYGILTNKRYGLGNDISPSDIDKFSFYTASQHNNQYVADGFGGVERRFLFNGVLQGDQDAWEVIVSICSSFAAKPFWDGSQISIWQDRPTTALAKIITNADVEEGRFVYTSNEYKSIATVAKVSYSDPDQGYEPAVEIVEDPIGINQYGVHITEFTAFGETRRGGAVRAGRRVLLSSRLDNQQVSFKARPIASFWKPGDVIQIADSRYPQLLNPYDYDDWEARRKGGVISEATTTSVSIDKDRGRELFVTLIGSNFKIWVTLPDLTVEMRDLVNAPGKHHILYPSVPFSQAPLPHSNWMVQDSSAPIRQFRVLSVTPDKSQPLFEVTGLAYGN
jgi:predicted phage tail protein